MNIRFIGSKTLEYVLRRKVNLFLIVVVVGISTYMLSVSVSIFVRTGYYLYETEHVFRDENILNINILMGEQEDDAYYSNVAKFIEMLDAEWGKDFGKYMFIKANYRVSENIKKEETLYIDSDMFDLCKTEFYTEKGKAWIPEESNQGFLSGFVCKSRLEEYPIGTVIKNENTGTQTRIVGYFKEEQSWAPSLLLHESEPTIHLDDYIVSMMDNGYFRESEVFYGNIFNTLYIRNVNDTDDKTVKAKIRKYADEWNVKCYINTLEELIRKEKNDKKELFSAVGVLLVFCLVLAMIALLISFLADALSWKRDIAIMYVNGAAPVDIFAIICIVNTIKVIFGFGVSVFLYGRRLEGLDHTLYFNRAVPMLITFFTVGAVLFSYIAFKTVRQRKLVLLVGGEGS